MDLLREKEEKIREMMGKKLMLTEEEQAIIMEAIKRLQERLK